MSEQAIRHPRRGKAHRATTDAYTSTLYQNSTVCGRCARDMTERIDVERTDPDDRCKRCWPTLPTDRDLRGAGE